MSKSPIDDRFGLLDPCPEDCTGETDRRAGWAPCRSAESRQAKAGDVVPLDPGLEKSLSARSIDLARFFAETGKIVFRASGTCMFPAIRPGDVLHVAPKKAAEFDVGEIAVVRRGGRLFGHRVVEKGGDDGGNFIVTRPDRSSAGFDEPAHDGDILGIVDDVERGGKIHKLEKTQAGRLAKLAAAPSLALTALGQTAVEGAGEAASSLLEIGLYRKLAAAFFEATKGRYQMTVRMPLRPHLDMVLSRVFKGDAIDKLDMRQGPETPDSWTIAFEEGNRVAASLSFFHRRGGCPHEGWWLADAKVRVRYRGMGLARLLFVKACEVVARAGEPPIRVDFHAVSRHASWLKKELGLTAAGVKGR